jgi:hypothetical protein
MCGRYYRRSDKQRIAEAFKVGKLPFSCVKIILRIRSQVICIFPGVSDTALDPF